MDETEQFQTAWQWWESRRLRYNIGLIIAGISAFICYVAVVFLFLERIPDAEITLFTTLFQGIGYLIMMGLANICYLAGPIMEKIFQPGDLKRYRIVAYNLGFWVSVALPFSIPVLLLIFVITQPAWWTGG